LFKKLAFGFGATDVLEVASSESSSAGTLRSRATDCQSSAISPPLFDLTDIGYLVITPDPVIASSTRTRRTYSSYQPTDRKQPFLVGATRRVAFLDGATQGDARAVDLSFLRQADRDSEFHLSFYRSIHCTMILSLHDRESTRSFEARSRRRDPQFFVTQGEHPVSTGLCRIRTSTS
jgi:hypothetical protein